MPADFHLVIKQPPAGIALEKDLSNEKWMIVALTRNIYLKAPQILPQGFVDDWIAAQQFPIYGTFTIGNTNNMKSPGIGGLESETKIKYWRYSARERRLYFGSLNTQTVEPEQGKAYEKTYSALDEVVLYDAVYLGTHFAPLGSGPANQIYGSGAVLINSYLGALTTSASLFWRRE